MKVLEIHVLFGREFFLVSLQVMCDAMVSVKVMMMILYLNVLHLTLSIFGNDEMSS